LTNTIHGKKLRKLPVWFLSRNVNNQAVVSYRSNNRKKYEYTQNILQLFVDFKKAYDGMHRESLYNIMEGVENSKKLIELFKMCMKNTQY